MDSLWNILSLILRQEIREKDYLLICADDIVPAQYVYNIQNEFSDNKLIVLDSIEDLNMIENYIDMLKEKSDKLVLFGTVDSVKFLVKNINIFDLRKNIKIVILNCADICKNSSEINSLALHLGFHFFQIKSSYHGNQGNKYNDANVERQIHHAFYDIDPYGPVIIEIV